MTQQFWDEDLECMPLSRLVDLSQARFRELKVMERAATSALYRARWAAAGVVPENVRTYADLREVPYTTGGDLRDAQAQHHPDKVPGL